MFDKLIVSEPKGADFKGRKSYFMVSSLVVGVLFLTAVVFSIFAADYGLGNGGFELVEMVMPPEMAAAVEPEPEPQPSRSREQSQVPTRQANIDRIADSTLVPEGISTVANTQRERRPGRFLIDKIDTDPVGGDGTGRTVNGTGGGPSGLATTTEISEDASETQPPPIRKEPAKREVIRSIGVANGKATKLPKPAYPATAIAIGLQGKVDVQVTIDETGKVIAANAVSGHPFFRGPAEKAAWAARFTPTTLSNVPVKVTGVIVYNFTR